MATFCQRADHVLFALCIFVLSIVSHFSFEGGIQGGTHVRIALVPVHCLPFTYKLQIVFDRCSSTTSNCRLRQ